MVDELRDLAQFLASVSPDIPWHVTAFHPDFKMNDPPPTAARDLLRAAQIGVEAGLRFVYAGNLPGQLGDWENTRCPHCQETLVKRTGFLVHWNRVTSEGRCPRCQQTIPGYWQGRN